jgi:UrcA family protein
MVPRALLAHLRLRNKPKSVFNFTCKEITMNRLTSVIAIFTLALIQTAHAGAPTDELRTVTVHFADLDLDHMPGAAALYQRLKYAAQQVCSPLQGREIARRSRFDRCTKESVAASIAKVDRPVLTQYYRSTLDRSNAPVFLVKK